MKDIDFLFLTVTVETPEVEGGVILTVGMGDIGQLGLGEEVEERTRPALVPNLENIVAIAAGGLHTACVNKDGKVVMLLFCLRLFFSYIFLISANCRFYL